MKPILQRLETIRQSFRLPAPDFELMTATERAAASISNESVEPWDHFWRRVAKEPITELKWRDQARFIRDAWRHPEASDRIPDLLSFCQHTSKKAPANLLINTYLMQFPEKSPHFSLLSDVCKTIASRTNSEWHELGIQYQLWEPAEGTGQLADAISETATFRAALYEAGFKGELYRGRFARAAVESLCRRYPDLSLEEQEPVGRKLIAILGSDLFVDLRGCLAVALLLPWTGSAPPSKYKQDLIHALTKFGDPREKGPEWDAIANGAEDYFERETVAGTIELLSRWLGEESVREFFRIIARSTGNSQQWQARERFWSRYLEAGLIDGAWFALGPVAEQLVKNNPALRKGKYAKLLKGSASDEQSTLIMKVGNAVVAEWSDNGACRFWMDSDPSAPELYKGRYFSRKLRTTIGGQGFAWLPHNGGWQRKFTFQINRMTGISAPR